MRERKSLEINTTQALEMIRHFQTVFDVVRFVDPMKRKVLILDGESTLGYDKKPCHKVWNRTERCENCISVKAQCDRFRESKYEFLGDDVFQVVANPFVLCTKDGKKRSVVLELVNNTTDEIMFESFGKSELIEKINLAKKKIYEDSLTQVYNRRYFDERIFCYEDENNLTDRVVFVMIDLNRFKAVNDTYGHDAGDSVLAAVGSTLKTTAGSSDTVIRIGGDEFLVILKNCPAERAPEAVAAMRAAVHEIRYGREAELSVVANFGWAAADNFTPTDSCIEQLMREADNKMYSDKKTASRMLQ